MKGACDGMKPLWGGDKEEPTEHQPPECRVRVINGGRAIDSLLDSIRRELYEYNSRIRGLGYYLKPVHKVYSEVSGERRVYEYYGRYWWKLKRRGGRIRLIYAGKHRPRAVSLLPPPKVPLEGLTVVRVGEDIIIDCRLYNKYSWLFEGFKIECAP